MEPLGLPGPGPRSFPLGQSGLRSPTTTQLAWDAEPPGSIGGASGGERVASLLGRLEAEIEGIRRFAVLLFEGASKLLLRAGC
jgi:hypothetical protein